MKYWLIIVSTFSLVFCLVACKNAEKDVVGIEIVCGEIIHDEYIYCNCRARELDRTTSIKIKKRGNSSRIYPKASFTIELGQAVNFCNLTAEEDWILNAAYIDKTFMRNRLCYDLFLQMSPRNIAPNICYRNLKLNDKDQGIYLLTEKMTASKCGIGQMDTAGRLFKEPAVFQTVDSQFVQEARAHFGQVFPKPTHVIKSNEMLALKTWLNDVSPAIFNEEIEARFDLENLADWMIILLFSNNADGLFRNYYLVKQKANSPFQVCIWDYDESFGRYGDGRLSTQSDTIIDFSNHLLFSKLIDNEDFVTLLKTRWDSHRQKILTEAHVNQLIDNYQSELSPLIALNSAIWPLDGSGYKDEASFEQEVQLLRDFIHAQIPRLDRYFSNL